VISAEGKFSIDETKCRDCRKCAEACPMDAITKK
jgi:Fe-S-cluster-containing hydrogenase component 2